ncbi:MAG: aldolase/citrate lyase family protein [Kiritimatiellales bacterium]
MNVITMRQSRVLKKMRNGEVATCVKLNLADPAVTEIAALAGFDCVWLDMEHVPHTDSVIINHVRASKMHDMDTLVRVQRGNYSNLIHPLEMDATGVMVPHLMNLKEAKEIVYYTKFHPVGRRPLDGGYADGAYCLLPPDDYLKQANEQRFTVVQIEDPEPLDELEEIAKLDGIDMLFFGAADFSQGIGTPCRWDNPKIAGTRKRVAEVARKYGKFAGTPCGIGNFDEFADLGYQFLSVGADVVGLGEYFGGIVSALKGTRAGKIESIYKGK